MPSFTGHTFCSSKGCIPTMYFDYLMIKQNKCVSGSSPYNHTTYTLRAWCGQYCSNRIQWLAPFQVCLVESFTYSSSYTYYTQPPSGTANHKGIGSWWVFSLESSPASFHVTPRRSCFYTFCSSSIFPSTRLYVNLPHR